MPSKHLSVVTAVPLVAALLPLCAFQARAGASLFVDDAAVTPRDRCQVESWVRADGRGQELSAVPACNVAGTEFGLGASRDTHPGSGRSWRLGAKRLFRDFDAQRWGIGLSIGAEWTSESGAAWSASVPVSIALDPDRRVAVHTNLGWSRADAGRGALTGGIGIEIAANASWTVLAEVSGDDRGAAVGQFGVRRAWGDALSLDLLVGRRDDSDNGPWLTLGVNTVFPR